MRSLDLDTARGRLRDLLVERSVERRRVTLSSGRESDLYIDSKQTILGSEGAYLAGRLFLERLRELPEFGELSAVGGMELGSVPIGTAISVLSHLAASPLAHLVIRKERKSHGTEAGIEGRRLVEPGASIAVVEDVVTTGGSSLAAAERLVEAGFVVRTLVALVDREEGGREAIEAAGYRFEALYDRADLGL